MKRTANFDWRKQRYKTNTQTDKDTKIKTNTNRQRYNQQTNKDLSAHTEIQIHTITSKIRYIQTDKYTNKQVFKYTHTHRQRYEYTNTQTKC